MFNGHNELEIKDLFYLHPHFSCPRRVPFRWLTCYHDRVSDTNGKVVTNYRPFCTSHYVMTDCVMVNHGTSDIVLSCIPTL